MESPGQPPLSAAERSDLAAAFALAEQLGAETATISGPSVSEALLAFARAAQHQQDRGRQAGPRPLARPLRGSLVDAIVRASGDIDVFIVSGERAEEPPPARGAAGPLSARPLHYVWSVRVCPLCTLVCWSMLGRFDRSNLVMVYLLGVAFVASRYGRGPSALAAVLSVAAFDFFFVPPHLTFAVSDSQYVVTFAVMLVVSLVISTLAAQVRAQADAARQAGAADAGALRDEPRPRGRADGGGGRKHRLAPRVGGVRRKRDRPRAGPRGCARSPGSGDEPAGDAREGAVAQWAFDHGQMAGLGTDTLPGASATWVPLRGTQTVLGVLGIRPDPGLLPLRPDQVDVLEALSRQAASGLERARLAEEAQQARIAVEAERLRSTLLSSVSHDLRTPLATITGAASSLLQDASLGPEGRRELEAAIYEEAVRLNRLVTNLLDMTRLESGSLQLNRDWHSVEELVGSALARLETHPEGPRGPGPGPRGPPSRARRRRARRAGPREPPGERREVHRPSGRDRRHGEGRGRLDRGGGGGRGAGPPAGDGGAGLREVLPRRVGPAWIRSRPSHLPGDRDGSRRPHLGGEAGAAGDAVPLHAPPGRDSPARTRGRR